MKTSGVSRHPVDGPGGDEPYFESVREPDYSVGRDEGNKGRRE